MSNSSLTQYIDRSTDNWNDRRYKISRITIHHAAGVCRVEDFSSILRSGREVSWNYAIGNDGKIGLFVDENHRAWTSCNQENDHRAITIEVSNSYAGDDWPVSSEAYESLLNLCTDICRRNDISELTYTGSLEGSNLTMHCWFASTLCPGPYLKSKFPDIVKEVNRRLVSGDSSSISVSTKLKSTTFSAAVVSASSYELLDATLNGTLYPYIVGLDRNTVRTLDYTKLHNRGVVAALIEAGYLYDVAHKQVNFKNPKFDIQVSQAKSNKIPFAVYMIARARNILEVDAEVSELMKCIRYNPPTLGVWLDLNLSKSITNNDIIIQYYQSRLENEGLRNKIGFYVTETQLKQISWSKHQNNWYLWLRKNISDVTELDSILTSEFFKLNSKEI